MRKPIMLAVCIACLATAVACAPPVAESPDDTVEPRVHSVLVPLPRRDGVLYYESGIHETTQTSVAVGTLSYRADSESKGSWLLFTRGDPVDADKGPEPFATLVGGAGFDSELWPLDGQYVAAEGSVIGTEGAYTGFEVDGLSLVADIFPTTTNEYSDPGLYYLPDGQPFIFAWVGGTTDGTTTLQDQPPGSDTPANVIALIRKAGKGPPAGVFFEARCAIVETDPVPVVAILDGGGYSPGKPMGMQVGRPAEWEHIERAGVKDRPDGRTRVVGLLMGGEMRRDPEADLEVWISEPWPMYPISPSAVIALDDPDGLIDVPESELNGHQYVGVEGVLGPRDRLLVDAFEVIRTP